MNAFEILFLVIGGILSGLIGVAIGRPRRVGTLGFWAGFLLGPVGWLALYLCYPAPAEPAPGAARKSAGKGFRTPEDVAKERAWDAARLGE